MFNCGILAIELNAPDIDQLFLLQGEVTVHVDAEKGQLTASEAGGENRSVTCVFSLNPFDMKLVRAGGWLAYADQNY